MTKIHACHTDNKALEGDMKLVGKYSTMSNIFFRVFEFKCPRSQKEIGIRNEFSIKTNSFRADLAAKIAKTSRKITVPRRLAMFNALGYIRRLEDVGFPREQAEAQVQMVIDSYEENVATKSDIAELKIEIAQLKAELIVKLGGLILVATGLLGLLIKL